MGSPPPRADHEIRLRRTTVLLLLATLLLPFGGLHDLLHAQAFDTHAAPPSGQLELHGDGCEHLGDLDEVHLHECETCLAKRGIDACTLDVAGAHRAPDHAAALITRAGDEVVRDAFVGTLGARGPPAVTG